MSNSIVDWFLRLLVVAVAVAFVWALVHVVQELLS
jgi:hypothetical protein